jgi:hypothetical protein
VPIVQKFCELQRTEKKLILYRYAYIYLPMTEQHLTEFFLLRQVTFYTGTWSLDSPDCECFPLKRFFRCVQVLFKTGLMYIVKAVLNGTGHNVNLFLAENFYSLGDLSDLLFRECCVLTDFAFKYAVKKFQPLERSSIRPPPKWRIIIFVCLRPVYFCAHLWLHYFLSLMLPVYINFVVY